MREPVLVGVQPDEVLQRDRGARLLVRLELRKVDYERRTQSCAGKEVLMYIVVVVFVRVVDIESGTVEPASLDAVECGRLGKIDLDGPGGIARKCEVGDGNSSPLL